MRAHPQEHVQKDEFPVTSRWLKKGPEGSEEHSHLTETRAECSHSINQLSSSKSRFAAARNLVLYTSPTRASDPQVCLTQQLVLRGMRVAQERRFWRARALEVLLTGGCEFATLQFVRNTAVLQTCLLRLYQQLYSNPVTSTELSYACFFTVMNHTQRQTLKLFFICI